MTNSSWPVTFRISAAMTLTTSLSVPASSGWSSLHLATILAVPNAFCIFVMVIWLSPRKKCAPSESCPSLSHSFLVNPAWENPLTGGSTSHGRGKLAYPSWAIRLPGSSYGARISRSRRNFIFWTSAACGVEGSNTMQSQSLIRSLRGYCGLRQYDEALVHRATVPPLATVWAADAQKRGMSNQCA